MLCTKRVYEKTESGELVVKNNIRARTAYVYLEEDEDIKLSDANVCYRDGVQELYVYKKTMSGRYEHDNTLIFNERRKKSPSSDHTTLAIALILFLFLLVIIIIYLLSCYQYPTEWAIIDFATNVEASAHS